MNPFLDVLTLTPAAEPAEQRRALLRTALLRDHVDQAYVDLLLGEVCPEFPIEVARLLFDSLASTLKTSQEFIDADLDRLVPTESPLDGRRSDILDGIQAAVKP